MNIYKITNLINNKIYIGQDSKDNYDYFGSGKLIKRAIKKYNKDNFKKEIIEYCNTRKQLNEREIFWIKKLSSKNKNIGYNIAAGGNNFMLGVKFTKEHKKKLSNNHANVEGKNNPNYGKEGYFKNKKRPEHSKKMSGKNNVRFGKHFVMDENIKKKISESLKGKFKGRIVSKETREKISIANKGKKRSEECKIKISKILKGRKHSEESKKLMSINSKGKNKGIKRTEEQKQYLRDLYKGKTLKERYGIEKAKEVLKKYKARYAK